MEANLHSECYIEARGRILPYMTERAFKLFRKLKKFDL